MVIAIENMAGFLWFLVNNDGKHQKNIEISQHAGPHNSYGFPIHDGFWDDGLGVSHLNSKSTGLVYSEWWVNENSRIRKWR